MVVVAAHLIGAFARLQATWWASLTMPWRRSRSWRTPRAGKRSKRSSSHGSRSGWSPARSSLSSRRSNRCDGRVWLASRRGKQRWTPPPITPYPRPPTVPMPRRAGGPAQALLVLEQHQWWQATQRAAAGPGGRNDPRPAPRPLGLWPRGVPALHLRGAAVPGAGPPLPLAPFPSSSCWSRERHGGAAGAVGDGQPGRHGREDPAVVPAAVRTSGWWWWQWRWVG